MRYICLVLLFVSVWGCSTSPGIPGDQKTETGAGVRTALETVESDTPDDSAGPFNPATLDRINALFETRNIRYRIFDSSKNRGGARGETPAGFEYDPALISGIGDSMILARSVWTDSILPVLFDVIDRDDYSIRFSNVTDYESGVDADRYRDFTYDMILTEKSTGRTFVFVPMDFSAEYFYLTVNE